MGIQDLTKSIKKHAPGAITVTKPCDVLGDILGVDVLSYLYPAKYNPGAKGKGQHIRFFFDLIVTWISAGKRLVMVFDGNTASSTKMDTVLKRQEVRQHNKDIITEMTERIHLGVATDQDHVELERATRSNINISTQDTDDLKTLFTYLNIPYYQATGEADCLLAALFTAGKIHGVISEDSDMLTHGIGIVIRGLIDSTNRTAGVVNMYQLSHILTGFDMTMEQFVDFCILSGCDYCPRVPGCGPVNSFNHIKTGGTPLTLKHTLPENYESKYREAVRMFTEHDENIETGPIAVNVNNESLKTWLLSNTNFTEKTVDEKLRVLTAPAPVPDIRITKIKPKILPKK